VAAAAAASSGTSLGTALIASSAISGAFSFLGAQKQRQALSSQEKSLERYRQQVIELQQQMIASGVPFRELAQQSAELIGQDLLREPGTGPVFERALQRGQQDILKGAAGKGLSDSSVAGVELGEFRAGLTTRDIENVRNQRLNLLGYGTMGYAQGGQFAQLGANLLKQQAEYGAAQGSSQAAAFGAVGQTIAQLPLTYSLLNK
jgi:hypothetical protein